MNKLTLRIMKIINIIEMAFMNQLWIRHTMTINLEDFHNNYGIIHKIIELNMVMLCLIMKIIIR